MKPDISIVVCLLDEEGSIEPFLGALDAVLPTLGVDGHELVFVDDGSTDSTWQVLKSLAHTRDDLVALRLVRNSGKENALTAGLAAASGRAHIPMDVDLQDPPGVLSDLVEKWQGGAGNVLARRTERKDSLFRRVGAALAYRMIGLGGEIEIPRNVSDFRLMTADTTERFLALPERSRYNKGLFAMVSNQYEVVEYERPAARVKDPRGSRQSFRRLAELATSGVVSFSLWPLRLLSILGFVVLGLSFIGASLAIVLRTLNILEVPGQTTVIVLFAALLGFQALSSGILGLYIGQVLEEVKGRPLFLIAESFGLDTERLTRLDNIAAGSANSK